MDAPTHQPDPRPSAGPAERRPKRPRWRRRIACALGALVACTGLAALYAACIEPRWLAKPTVAISLPDWPAALDGLRIVHLTDPHFGEGLSAERLASIVAEVNAQSPDLVVLTGDYISEPRGDYAAMAEVLSELRATHGIFAVMGNHDYWNDPVATAEMLRRAGIEVLSDRHVILHIDNQPLCIAGVSDLDFGTPNPDAALVDVPADCPRLVLSHNPDLADHWPVGLRRDLMLCGHTHGGQVKLPGLGPLYVPIQNWRYREGLIVTADGPIYVSRGVGTHGLAVRFCCRPELPTLLLQAE